MKILNRRFQVFLYFLLSIFIVTSCSGREHVSFIDAVGRVEKNHFPGQKNGVYTDTVWLTPEWVIFQYAAEKDITSQNLELVAVNVRTEERRVMPSEIPECPISRFGYLSELPNGQLGFLHECYNTETFSGRVFSLYSWELDTNEIRLIHSYPEYFLATAFSASPNSLEIIQERGGSNPAPTMHLVTEDGHMEQFFPDFFRTRSPAYSPNGQQLAFFGNEIGPEEKSSIFTGLVALNNVIDYPWNLYKMVANSREPEIILTEILYAKQLIWFPNGQSLAFSGEYRDYKGIFVFNLETNEVTRIRPISTGFDLSPDGTQLIILDVERGPDSNGTSQPVIIDISFLQIP